jgi:hypothetical protein
MANLSVIRNALAQVISTNTYPQLPCYAQAPDTLNLPCAVVLPAKNVGKYGITLVGNPATQPNILAVTEFNIDILVIVSRSSTIDRVQDTLDQWLGFENDATTVSVPMAIALNESLNGTVQFCEPINVDSYGPIEWNATTYFGARIHTVVSVV